MTAKIFLLVIFTVSILAPFRQAQAQQPAKIPKIGFLGAGSSSRPWHESSSESSENSVM